LHTTFKLQFIPRLPLMLFSTKSFAKKGCSWKNKRERESFMYILLFEIVENPTLNLWKKIIYLSSPLGYYFQIHNNVCVYLLFLNYWNFGKSNLKLLNLRRVFFFFFKFF
jgi:hypothetical protein